MLGNVTESARNFANRPIGAGHDSAAQCRAHDAFNNFVHTDRAGVDATVEAGATWHWIHFHDLLSPSIHLAYMPV